MRKFLLALASAVVLFAANEVGHLSGDEVSKLVGSKDAVIVDVRVDEQFNEGHIKDAVHIPLKDIEANPGKFKDFDGKKVVLYCNSGRQSGKAAEILHKNGIKDVYNADGVKQYKYDLVK